MDIDITGKPVIRRTTKDGKPEIVIQDEIKPSDIVGSGRTRKSTHSR
jgi:hypothetical protein